MKKRVREKISAYLDGEAEDAQAIARMIAASGDASKEHLAFAELSARIRNLEAPQVHPAFAARVVATIEEQRERRSNAWRIPAGIAAAAAIAIVAYISLNATGPLVPNTPADNIAAVPGTTSFAANDEDQLLAELERRVALDAEVQQFLVARFDNAPDTADLYTDRLLAAIARSDGAAAASAALSHGVDYRATVHRLDGDQAAALKRLLAASMQEALEG